MDKNYIEHGYEFLSSFSFCGLQLLGSQGSLVLRLAYLTLHLLVTSVDGSQTDISLSGIITRDCFCYHSLSQGMLYDIRIG
ncbi:hypothetical protein Peur_040991 [Populus x canadensis]